MFFLVTDHPDVRWLQYVLDEFARIQDARFKLLALARGEAPPADALVLSYSRTPDAGPCLPDCSGDEPDGRIAWLSDSLFVPECAKAEGGFALPFDPFWAAFILLSRLEEQHSLQPGRMQLGYAAAHPRQDKTTFRVPAVNHIFAALEGVITSRFPQLPFAPGQSLSIEFSHDVDYVAKTLQLRLKQTAFNAVNLLRRRGSLFKLTTFLLDRADYWRFDEWAELERSRGLRSVFYVYARARRRSPRDWLIDPSYSLSRHSRLRETLRALAAEGFEIGLHGGFASAANPDLLAAEKACLERSLGREVSRSRQHWLRHIDGVTDLAHESLFSRDSTLGFNDRMGFRAGCASPYRPWSHAENRPLRHLVVPLALMDSTIFDYGDAPGGNDALAMLRSLAKLKNAQVSVSWHQRTLSPEYGWGGLYERIAEELEGD